MLLHGEADDHGRVYQQGAGNQYNVERGFFLDASQQLPWVSDATFWPTVQEADPLELGVHRAAILNGNAVPPYVTRDVDALLRSQVGEISASGGLVVIVGDSTAGKTRTAYEAARALMPDHRVFVPDDAMALRSAIPSLLGTPDLCLVWLDDVDRFLAEGGLTVAIVRHLARKGVAMIATVRSERYRHISLLGANEDDQHGSAHPPGGEGVVNMVEPVLISRQWSDEEQQRAASSGDDRLENALQHADLYGVAEFMAAGPSLLRQLEVASEGGGHPRGAALVRAAVDLTRAGLGGSITRDVLDRGHVTYLENAGGQLLHPEPFEEAMKWATARRYGVTSFLLQDQTPGLYRAFDYLVDVAERSDRQVLPQNLWDIALSVSVEDARQCLRVAFAASSHQRDDIAEAVLADLVEREVDGAARRLARLYQRQDRFVEAAAVLRRAVDQGDAEAAVSLGIGLERAGRQSEAKEWYRRSVDMGSHHGMAHLAFALQAEGEIEQAEMMFRQAADEEEAVVGLGDLLRESGRVAEAEEWLRRSADEGSLGALMSLGVVFADSGRAEEAVELWKRADVAEVKGASFNLGALFASEKRYAEAERWYRKAVEQGLEEARGRLGAVLAQQEKLKEAEPFLREAAEEEADASAMSNLSLLLLNRGDREEAIEWARRAIESGETSAALKLGDALSDLGDHKNAFDAWKTAAEGGELAAHHRMGLRCKELGDTEAAEEHFRSAAEDVPEAACQLASLLAQRGEEEESERWLRVSAAEGHGHANCLLGGIAASRGDVSGAETAWSTAYQQGHTDSAARLAELLARQSGRGGDAAKWMRIARGVGGRPGGNRRKPSGRRKKKRR